MFFGEMSIDLVAKIPAEGFDPSASRLWDSRSNQLSYTGLHDLGPISLYIIPNKIGDGSGAQYVEYSVHENQAFICS